MAIYSFSELIPKVFSATITFATELAVLDDCDDQVIAAQRHGLFTDAYKDFSKGLRELEQSTLDLTPDLQIAIEAIKTIDNDCRARCISIGEAALFYAQRRRKLDEAAHNGWVAVKNDGVLPPSLTSPDNTAQVDPESQTRLNSESESCAELGTASRHLDSIEKLEHKTPQLDTKSVEWIGARQENKKKLRLPLPTLRDYRLSSKGGRKMPDKMFGIDRAGRRWRRQGTQTSMVYYYVPSLPKSVE